MRSQCQVLYTRKQAVLSSLVYKKAGHAVSSLVYKKADRAGVAHSKEGAVRCWVREGQMFHIQDEPHQEVRSAMDTNGHKQINIIV